MLLLLLGANNLRAAEVVVDGRTFTLPDGYDLSRAASAPLTSRPICIDQDEQGQLYVAESSGSNDDVETQLRERPHQILRLTDRNQDGVYDERTVFVDRIMLPEGTLWYDGSLYVTAPPVIWKFRDDDGDGRAEHREVWFDGQTLTGCANDLHGPFLGPDGWIYWCKGAFAEQQHELTSGRTLTTRAAHIFRRHPQGGPLEVVMTGGMDNPVELVFTPEGERIFSTTFFQHPAGGQRDGLIHAIYGGVYGKPHGVLEGHVRTGDLLPPMTHLGAAAPSGLARLRSDALGMSGQVVTACFNLHSVTRHELTEQGAHLRTSDSTLLATNDLDFHPTDVMEDADGSLLVVDTGGWYKLCCPTSSLHKPDVAGGIYRLSRNGATLADPWGTNLPWSQVTTAALLERLEDPRPRVRDRAQRSLRQRGEDGLSALAAAATDTNPYRARRAVWALCRLTDARARAAVRSALGHADRRVRHAAIHCAGLWRDREAYAPLQTILREGAAAERRAAAEAIGRLGRTDAIESLLTAIEEAEDRILEHSLVFALIEIGDVASLRRGLTSQSPRVVRATLTALDQLPGNQLQADEVCSHLLSSDPPLQKTAAQIAAGRDEWADAIGDQLKRLWKNPSLREQDVRLLTLLSENSGVMKLLLPAIAERPALQARAELVRGLERLRLEGMEAAVINVLRSGPKATAMETLRALAARRDPLPHALQTAVEQIALNPQMDAEIRLEAITLLSVPIQSAFPFLLRQVDQGQPARHRALAASILGTNHWDAEQLRQLIDHLVQVGPLELRHVLRTFEKRMPDEVAAQLFEALGRHAHLSALPPQQIEALTQGYPGQAQHTLRAQLKVQMEDLATQDQRIESLLVELPPGDVRRGERVFYSEKTACFACHAIGYRGGNVGPDLSRIARVRDRASLLESILYPSRTFVRSYEPVTVVTSDGTVFSGTIRDQTQTQIVMQTSATQQQIVATEAITTQVPGTVSIMPQGIEKQLSAQELADLLQFLETRK